MKHLMVAGCSFSAVSHVLPDTAWSEVLAQKLGGWKLTNLARQGCSNGGVRIQIEEILRQRPEFAIITPTFWDRMELPANAAPYNWDNAEMPRGWEALPPGWSPKIQHHLQDRSLKNGYRREDGINNINYGKNNYNMICETIFTLAENINNPYRAPISKEAQNAVRHYIDAIYDTEWKKQQDEWLIKEGLFELYHAGINFLFVPVLLWPFDPIAGEQGWKDIMPATIPERYVMSKERESILPICGDNLFTGKDPGYHSNPAGQEIIAENYYRRIMAFNV